MRLPEMLCLAVVLLMLLTLGGCKDDGSEYRRGYKDGSEASAQESYARGRLDGYRSGFSQARPGSPTTLTGSSLAFYKALIWGGAVKLIFSLLFSALFLFKKTDTATQIVGKVLFSIIGAVIGVALILYTRASDEIVSFILIPAPSSAGPQAVIFLFAAGATFFLFFALHAMGSTKELGTYIEAWLLALIAAIVAIAIPALKYLAKDVPDITGYIASSIFLGALLGGLFWIANHFLSRGEVTNDTSESERK